MKRMTQLALGCLSMVLMMVSLAAAQQPQQVVRLGDWVEIGNELFMNFITTLDFRYVTVGNYDFESKIQDRVPERDPNSTLTHNQECDCLKLQAQLGADFRFGKSLTARILLRHDTFQDGNLSDGRSGNDFNPGGTDQFGRDAESEAEAINLERAYIDWKVLDTPVHIQIGTDLWRLDEGGLIQDDDPRLLIYANFGPQEEWEVSASAVIQNESARIGLINDNDYVYYTFTVAYNRKPHRFELHGVYSRDRFRGAQNNAGAGQKIDSIMVVPAWKGTVGPITAMIEGAAVFGSAKPSEAADAAGQSDYDIFSWAVLAYAQAKLGIVSPFVGFLYASGDDNRNDNDLGGFYMLPQSDSGVNFTHGDRDHLERAPAVAGRDVSVPARANLNATPQGGPYSNANPGIRQALGGGANAEYGHTVGGWFNDRIGRDLHDGVNTAYSNPGVFIPFAGVQIFPVKGHELTLYYFYRAMADSHIIEQAARVTDPSVDIDEAMYHNLGAAWGWTVNRHLDLRVTGNVIIPLAGSKDIAGTADCSADPGFQGCDGEDIALWGEFRMRARF